MSLVCGVVSAPSSWLMVCVCDFRSAFFFSLSCFCPFACGVQNASGIDSFHLSGDEESKDGSSDSSADNSEDDAVNNDNNDNVSKDVKKDKGEKAVEATKENADADADADAEGGTMSTANDDEADEADEAEGAA